MRTDAPHACHASFSPRWADLTDDPTHVHDPDKDDVSMTHMWHKHVSQHPVSWHVSIMGSTCHVIRMLECRKKVRIGWEGLEIHELKFDVIFFTNESLVDKENSSRGRKVQNQMFMDSIKFYPRFNWIYGGLDCKKNWFLSQFRFLLDEIKVLGSDYNFEELICSN
jgi:hypothetical protein